MPNLSVIPSSRMLAHSFQTMMVREKSLCTLEGYIQPHPMILTNF